MREFNLEAAKRGEPIVCRDGTPAKFIAHVPEAHPTQRLIVLVNENIYGYLESGQWTEIKNDPTDLFMDKKKRTVQVNFYFQQSAMYYESQDAANYAHNTFHEDVNRIGNRAYPVEIEE